MKVTKRSAKTRAPQVGLGRGGGDRSGTRCCDQCRPRAVVNCTKAAQRGTDTGTPVVVSQAGGTIPGCVRNKKLGD